MEFTSPQYLLFFAIVCGLSYLTKHRVRKYFLLFSSFVFIAYFNWLALASVIIFSTITFATGRQITKGRNASLFYAALLINGFAIILFNYLLSARGTFFLSFGEIDFSMGSVMLFIGLSFYNLQHVAYLVDIRKGRIIPENDLVDFLLISAYFPKFISGPLTLYQQMKPQVSLNAPENAQFWQGFNRMLFGFFKKMVIADRLAPSVSSVFDYGDDLPGLTVLMGAILFTIQLYFDFSGYTDIAIGSSKMLGITLPENFDFPLRAQSVTQFWRKWHRSLIGFFTTYIFYPVSYQFRRFKIHSSALAIMATFTVSALWHGIGLTFMLWALCHMIYLIAELYMRKTNVKQAIFFKLIGALKVLLLVAFSNIFFRATSTSNATHLLSCVFSKNFFPNDWAAELLAPIAVGGHQVDQFNMAATFIFLFLTLVFERKAFNKAGSTRFMPLITFVLIMIIFLFGVIGNGQRFIYMQF